MPKQPKNSLEAAVSHAYDDIIHLPHHCSATHPAMSPSERAAQFSPFDVLSGHQEALEETARQNEAHSDSVTISEDELLADLESQNPSQK